MGTDRRLRPFDLTRDLPTSIATSASLSSNLMSSIHLERLTKCHSEERSDEESRVAMRFFVPLRMTVFILLAILGKNVAATL